jgi:hypothetical protein
MGCYVNPPDGRGPVAPGVKEKWLEDNNQVSYVANKFPEWHEPDTDMLVCLVINNSSFTAAGVVYDKQEYDEFKRDLEYDHRQFKWYLVPVEKLKTVSPIERYMNG